MTAGDVYYLIATSYSGMIIKGGSAASIRRRPGLLLLRIGDKLGSGDGDVIWSATCARLVWSLSFAIGWDLLLSRLVSLVEAAVDSISRLPCSEVVHGGAGSSLSKSPPE